MSVERSLAGVTHHTSFNSPRAAPNGLIGGLSVGFDAVAVLGLSQPESSMEVAVGLLLRSFKAIEVPTVSKYIKHTTIGV